MQPWPTVAHGDGQAADLLPGWLWSPLVALRMNVGGPCLFLGLSLPLRVFPLLGPSLCLPVCLPLALAAGSGHPCEAVSGAP